MKRWFISFAMLLTGLTGAQAQDVYNYLMTKANSKVNSTFANEYEIQKYDFELTALHYMRNQARKQQQEITSRFLDEQAYGMDTFLITYLQTLKRTTVSERKAVTRRFIQASLDNPMYNDSDTETTLVYASASGALLPFSLDTDWVKALEQVSNLQI